MIEALEEYVKFVNTTVTNYQKSVQLVDKEADEVTPQMINTALSNYGGVSLMLIAEYNRKKAELRQEQIEYGKWWDEKYSNMRRKMQGEVPKTTKIAQKEVEIEVRVQNRIEYDTKQACIFEAEQKVSFYLRLLDMWRKMDNILVNISFNMRSELRALSIDSRMNSQKAMMGSMPYKDQATPLPVKPTPQPGEWVREDERPERPERTVVRNKKT